MALFSGRPGASLSVSFGGAFDKWVRELAKRGKSTKPVMLRFGRDMQRSTDRNFIVQGRLNAGIGIWKPLAPSTIRRRRKGEGRRRDQILQDTGTLRKSIVTEATRKSLTVGTNVPYAKYHQQRGLWGTKSGHVPARPFLWFHRTDLERFLKRLNEYIQEGPKQGNFKGV